MTALPVLFMIIILGLVSVTINNQLAERSRNQDAEGIVTTITQIARAQHFYHSQNPGAVPDYLEAEGNHTDMQTLIPTWSTGRYSADRYYTIEMPADCDPLTPGIQNPPPATPDTCPLGAPFRSPGFTVHYDAQGPTTPGLPGPHFEARTIGQAAARLGPIACPAERAVLADTYSTMTCTTTNVQGLTATFTRSIDMTLVDEFLPLNGERSMIGNLNMLINPAGTTVASINTSGHMEAQALMNLGFTFTDTDEDGELSAGDTTAGDGIMITNDGAFHAFAGGAEFVRLEDGSYYAYNTGIATPGATPTDTAPLEIDARDDTIRNAEFIEDIDTVRRISRVDDVTTMNNINTISNVNSITAVQTIDADEGSFDELVLNP